MHVIAHVADILVPGVEVEAIERTLLAAEGEAATLVFWDECVDDNI